MLPLDDVAYDSISIEEWKMNTMFDSFLDFRPLTRRYKSIWRVLHVDGFEAGKPVMFKTFSSISEPE
jgi:hypothetical protein